jgi:hypothetical protein
MERDMTRIDKIVATALVVAIVVAVGVIMLTACQAPLR